MKMDNPNKIIAETCDVSVHRTLQRFAGCNDAWETPIGDATFEDRCQTLRDAIDAIDDIDPMGRPLIHYGTGSHIFRPFKSYLISDKRKRAIILLENLLAAPWEKMPESLCLQTLAMEELAYVRKLQGDFSGCVAAFQEAVKLAASVGPDMHAKRCGMLLDLSTFMLECDKIEECTVWAQKAAELSINLSPEVLDARFFWVLMDLADALSNNGEMEKSLVLALKAEEIAEKNLSSANKDVRFFRRCFQHALLQLAVVYCRRGELDAAETAVLRANKLPGTDTGWLLDYMEKLADICEKHGDMTSGISFRYKAVAICRKSEDEEWLIKLLGDLGIALTKAAKWREAYHALDEALSIRFTISKRRIRHSWRPRFDAYREVHYDLRNGKYDDARDFANHFEAYLRWGEIERIIWWGD